jgi:hypothetical protein
MSEPTYKIVTEHDPAASSYNPWEAKVTRLSDEQLVKAEYGASEAEVIAAATEWINRKSSTFKPGRVLYATEDGTLVEGVTA